MLSAGRDVLPTIFVWNSGQDVQYVIVFQPSILTEFLGLKLHFFTYKSTEFFPLYCYDEGIFLLLTVRNEEGRTVQLVLQHAFSVSTAPGWQPWHLFEQDSFGLEVC